MFGLMVEDREHGEGQSLPPRALGSRLGLLLGLWLSVGGCSDDGLAPAQNDEGTTGGRGETSSVNTSATLSASASDSNNSNDSPGGTESPPDGSSGGPNSTGTPDGTSGWEGSTGSTGDASGDSGPVVGTTGDDEPECVASDDCDCAADEVICEAAPPVCPPGRVAEVDAGLGCWTFECVPAESCTAVPDCLACTGDLACVASVARMGPTLTCEVVPPECMGEPTCDCMPDACAAPLECLGIPPKGDAALVCE